MGYDDDQGPLLARIYFPQTGVFELHDNSYIRYQTLNDEVESKTSDLPASHAVWLLNRVPNSKYVPNQKWLTPRQQQFPDRKVTDLTKLQPFGITCWTHIKKARRPGKSDINPRGEQGRLVGYDDDQGPIVS